MSETNITRSLRIFKLCYVRGHFDIAKDVALSIFGVSGNNSMAIFYDNALQAPDFETYYNDNKQSIWPSSDEESPAPDYNTLDINFYYNSESGHFLEYDSNGNLIVPNEVDESPTFEVVEEEHHIDLTNDLDDGDKLEIRVLDDENEFQDVELEAQRFRCSIKYKYLDSNSTVKADDITLINGGYHFDGPDKYFTRHDKFGVHSDVFEIKEGVDEQENYEAVIIEDLNIDDVTLNEHMTREPEKETRSQKIKVNNTEKELFQVPKASRKFFTDYIQLDDGDVNQVIRKK